MRLEHCCRNSQAIFTATKLVKLLGLDSLQPMLSFGSENGNEDADEAPARPFDRNTKEVQPKSRPRHECEAGSGKHDGDDCNSSQLFGAVIFVMSCTERADESSHTKVA
jgi:hypothetical protein